MGKRPVRTCACGRHSWVELTPAFIALFDPEFAPVVARHSWNAVKTTSRGWYARRGQSAYIDGKKVRFPVMLHNVIKPCPPGFVLDHRNRDSLDNRSENLRIATTSQNCMNSAPRKKTSPFKGVSKHRQGWQASINANKKHYFLGIFKSETEAARAYDAAAIRLHKEFAYLNFPEAAVSHAL